MASGGHTFLARVSEHDGYETLGQTLDDAAGEAFDKGARLLGLGYPGGPALSKLALEGDPTAFKFPIAAHVAGLDFSFAGLKTALLYKVRDLGDGGDRAPRGGPRRLLRARDRRGADAPRRARAGRTRPSRAWRSAAAWPRTACCAARRRRSACPSTCPRTRSAPTTRR